MKKQTKTSRRNFLKGASILTAGFVASPLLTSAQINLPAKEDNSIYLIGPQDGYSPHIGALLSTMTMMRKWVIDTVKDLTVEQLDFQIDEKSNAIGAMLLHLAATERYYQLNTFDNLDWGTWDDAIKEEWDVASGLGEKGREEIKGHDVSYYLAKLEEVRKVTEQEFAKRDDDWLMKAEPFFEGKQTNNYCKWFHVCEHESNHRGQMKFILKRLPS